MILATSGCMSQKCIFAICATILNLNAPVNVDFKLFQKILYVFILMRFLIYFFNHLLLFTHISLFILFFHIKKDIFKMIGNYAISINKHQEYCG